MTTRLLPIGRDVSILMLNLDGTLDHLKAVAKIEGNDAQPHGETMQSLERVASHAEQVAKSLQMNHSIMGAMQLAQEMKGMSAIGNSPKFTVGIATTRLTVLRETLLRDLFEPLFLPSTQDMRDYLDLEHPFGRAVEKAFPECYDDISEAHQCFAFERYTACMFHVGRAMELGAKKFGKKIGAATPARDEFQKWLSSINDKIKSMPFGSPKEKEKRELLTEAAAHFFNFKESFRNKTMHPEKTYTREQAKKGLEGAHAFFESVATRIFKAKA